MNVIGNRLLLSLLFLVLTSLARGEALLFQGSEIVLDLPISEDNPRNSEGDFIMLKDNRLLFIYTKFHGGGRDNDAANLVARISSDGGRTWSKEDRLIVPNKGGLNVMSVSLLRLQDGRIALFYLEKNSTSDCRPVLRISEDEGEHWSEVIRMISDDEIGYYVLNNDRVIQLKDGRLLAPLALHNRPGWEKPDRQGEIGVLFSDDGGATWTFPKNWYQATKADHERITAQEPGLVELNDGRLLMWVRTNAGEQYRSFSSDQGITWSPFEPMGVASPLSPASIERLPGSETLVMIWNDHTAVPVAERNLRTPLSIALSQDEGKSWSTPRVLEADPKGWYCYTAMEFTSDALYLAYVAGEQEPGKHLSATRLLRLPLVQLKP